jgi:hypothetical protein
MAGQLSGRVGGLAHLTRLRKRAGDALQSRRAPRRRGAAGRAVRIDEGDDAALHADRAGPAVEDEMDAAVQALFDMLGRRRADRAGRGWRWARRGAIEHGDQVVSAASIAASAPPGCRGRPAPDSLTGAASRSAAPPGSAARAKSVASARASGRKSTRRVRPRQTIHMGDQRIKARPALGLINPGDRLAIGGVARQPVDRLRGHGDAAASRQDSGGLPARRDRPRADRRVGGRGGRMALS